MRTSRIVKSMSSTSSHWMPNSYGSGAIIGDGDRKRAPFLVLGLGPMIWDNFSIFRTNCAIACGTRAYITARIFADVAQGKWRPKFPKWFMLLAQNPTPLWLLEFWLSIFVVSCSSLSEDSAEFRYVPLYMADHPSILKVDFRCSFYKNFTLLQSKFQIGRRLTAFPQQKKKTSWICLDIAAFQDLNVFLL